MGPGLLKLYTEQISFLKPTFNDKANGFISSPEYEGYLVKTGRATPLMVALYNLKLKPAKAADFRRPYNNYLHYRKAKQWVKAQSAYTSMTAIVPAAKLAPILTEAGQPIESVTRELKSAERAKALKPVVDAALSYFASAIKSVEDHGLPKDKLEVDRM